MTQVAILVRVCRSRVTTFSCETIPFFLRSVGFEILAVKPVTVEILSFVNRIAAIVVPLALLDLSTLKMDQLDSPAIDEFFATQVVSLDGTGTPKLTIATGYFDFDAVEAVCSAIAHSRSLRRVESGTIVYYGGRVEENDVWLWLIYALFSPDASHDIHTVGLNMETLTDVRCVGTMRSILRSQNPLGRLLEYIDDAEANGINMSSSPAAEVVLAPSTVVHRGMYDETIQDPGPLSIQTGVAYHVVYKYTDCDTIEILIPHLGLCWCKSSDVLETRPVSRREIHSVRHLRLKFVGVDSILPTLSLLEMIGGPLEHLTILRLLLSGINSTHFLDSVLTHCPNLKSLDVRLPTSAATAAMQP